MHGPMNVEYQTGSNVLMAATVFKFNTEQSTEIMQQEVADSTETLIPLCVILQENLKTTHDMYL
jgi:hypothetical protein